MKLVDEKKALVEISSLRKHRKTVESFSSQQAAIDADKAKIDQVRKELDDPEQKAASKKFDELRKELDEVNKRMEEVSKSRDGLYDERNARESSFSPQQLYVLTRSVRRSVSKQLDELWQKKKASATAFREANNAYCKRPLRARGGTPERGVDLTLITSYPQTKSSTMSVPSVTSAGERSAKSTKSRSAPRSTSGCSRRRRRPRSSARSKTARL